ncbi:tetratricopeptide repeat protein [Rhizosaccharibacter radicis]|uniref:Tetratricopeptide repeat protein n=1 Tax=Rhizosaccharibacter radicis TaxID=2782605 RepID=A0ABT1VZN6_9PROT|nr:hypothetical protein [Acetobacteraceae bacterium KSS12]
MARPLQSAPKVEAAQTLPSVAYPAVIPTPPAGVGAGPGAGLALLLPAAGGQPASLLLPAEEHTGAAGFVTGRKVVVVLDAPRPLDLGAALGDPTFAEARLTMLPDGVAMTVPLPADRQPLLRRVAGGWSLSWTLLGPTPAKAAIVGSDNSVFPVPDAGRVLIVVDPETGSDLLVGTVRRDSVPMEQSRRGGGFIVRPSVAGVVVERLADDVGMRATPHGFELTRPSDRDEDGHERRGSDGLGRISHLGLVPAGEIEQRLRSSIAAAAAAPTSERLLPRLDAAEAALGLGDGRLARSIARVAAQDAPSAHASQRLRWLLTASAALDGAEPDGWVTRALPPATDDELAAWEALAALAIRPTQVAAAAALAARIGVVLDYPQPLRQAAIERIRLAAYRGSGDVRRILASALPNDPALRMMKVLDEPVGSISPALSAKEVATWAVDRSPLLRVLAAEAVARDLIHDPDPRAAEKRLDAALLDARMIGAEHDLLLRKLELEQQAGRWQQALQSFDAAAAETSSLSNGLREKGVSLLKAMNRALMEQPASADARRTLLMSPLMTAHLDLLRGRPEEAGLIRDLASRYDALGLPNQAEALYRRALPLINDPTDRAPLGLAIARLQLDRDAPGEALATLEATGGDDPHALGRDRLLLKAACLLRAGRMSEVSSSLEGISGANAAMLRADAAEAAHDAAGEGRALRDAAATLVPSAGPLKGVAAELLLRRAGVAVTAHDEEALRELRAVDVSRFSDQSRRALFATLIRAADPHADDLALELSQARGALKLLEQPPAHSGGASR